MALRPSERAPTRGLSNPLIRRVMRHRNVATLFRSAPPEPMRAEQMELDPRVTIVAAVPIALPDIATAQEPVALPVGFASESLAAEGGVGPDSTPVLPFPASRIEAVPTTRSASSPQPIGAPPQARPSRPDLHTARKTVPTVGAVPAAGAIPMVGDEAAADGGATPREARSVASPRGGAGEATVQRTPTPPELRQPTRSPIDVRRTVPVPAAVPTAGADGTAAAQVASDRRSGVPTTEEKGITTSTTDPSSGTSITDDVWRRLRTIFQGHQSRDAAPKTEPPQLPEASIGAAPPTVGPEEVPGDVAVTRMPNAVAALPGPEALGSSSIARALPTALYPVRTEGPAQPPVATEWPAPAVELTESDEAQPLYPLEQLPLQSVWNVQSIPATPRLDPITADASQHARTATSQERVIQALDRVAPGGVTQSTIELLPTTRPRPQAQMTPTVETPADAVTRPPRAQPTGEPSLVQTAIGPLPADLWELIGAPIPDEPKSGLPTTEAGRTEPLPTALRGTVKVSSPQVTPLGTQSTETQGTWTQEAQTQGEPVQTRDEPARSQPARSQVAQTQVTPTQTQAMPPQTPDGPRTAGPHQIQRTLAPSASATAPSPTASAPPATATRDSQASPALAPSSGDAPATGATPEVDIAELARRVYADIKRRLSVERERSRSPWH